MVRHSERSEESLINLTMSSSNESTLGGRRVSPRRIQREFGGQGLSDGGTGGVPQFIFLPLPSPRKGQGDGRNANKGVT